MSKLFSLLIAALLMAACTNKTENGNNKFELQVAEYLEKFPYQETYEYMVKYTGGNPSRLNNPVDLEPKLVKAGEDVVVRTNNDTFYSGGFLYLKEGPVRLSANHSDQNRFYSFQLMDERNCNFHNIIRPDGDYFLYKGEKPTDIADEQLIESPSLIVGVIIRVEVKDGNDPDDVAAARMIYEGLEISGPQITEFPKLDLLGSFEEAVANRANELMDSVFANVPFRELVATSDMIPAKVSYLQHAAATKNGWGGPVAEHSTYQMFFFDQHEQELDGSKGDYILTTEEPVVDAFWSLTVYDTGKGGFFHPNKDDRYHINNTSAIRNEDGTISFLFKTTCDQDDINCLEVPNGKFDLTARYYLPRQEIIDGSWSMSAPLLIQNND